MRYERASGGFRWRSATSSSGAAWAQTEWLRFTGKNVDVFSIVPVKRSHSVCAQGGINGAVNTKG
ncbi:MAG TPA: hypothetical protein VE964_14055, partial [Myxococcales bacterium]|nr:hypothetical protein [Myxococcales bacterium]